MRRSAIDQLGIFDSENIPFFPYDLIKLFETPKILSIFPITTFSQQNNSKQSGIVIIFCSLKAMIMNVC